MSYTYYKEMTLEEHLLFAEEIADILLEMGYTVSINTIHKVMRNKKAEPLYYKTRAGLKKVYRLEEVIQALNLNRE